MKVLEPVPVDSIPHPPHGPRCHEELYQRVLFLDGLALPVEFETVKQAKHFKCLFCHPRGRARKLGLAAAQRGNTVFVYRKREEA